VTKNIWYISKYVTPTYAAKVGCRGFLILREFVQLGHKSVLITSDSNHLAKTPQFKSSRIYEVVDGVDVHWLKTKKYSSARSFARILSWLHFEWRLWRFPVAELPKPDVIIVSSLSLLTIINGIWLKKRFNCKLIFEVRDIWPLTLIESGNVSQYNPLAIILGWVEKLGYAHADVIVGTMPNLKGHVKKVLGFEKPVHCIPQGIDPSLLKKPAPLSDDYIKSYVPQGKFLVCYTGSIGSSNALETLFKCARLMRDHQDVHFLIVGDGYLKKQFQMENCDLKNITFAPEVKKSAVQSILSCADILYFAMHKSSVSKFGQSLNKLIDYMLSSKPIIASFSGFPSMINEAKCGTFLSAMDVIALRNEIERFFKMSPNDRSRIGKLGRKWLIKNRQFEVLARDYLLLM
jgi:glycosyltransferase involved in cell wall biosynthesis